MGREKEVGRRKWDKAGERWKYIANRVVQKQFLFGWAAGAATELADKIAIGS